MKKLLWILPLVVLCGCGVNNTPLQAVTDRYKTDQIKQVPSSIYNFIVKDTNGSIWFVETGEKGLNDDNQYGFTCIKNTLLFEGIKKVDDTNLK